MTMRESELARRLSPYIAAQIRSAVTGLEVASSQGGTGRHAIDGPFHTGTLRDAQAPQFVMLNGSRPLTADWNFNSGVRIDGMDPSAHVVNPNAHHNRQHSIVSASDHSAFGSQHSVVGMSSTNTLGILPTTTNGWTSPNQLLRTTASGFVTANRFIANSIGSAQTNLSIIPSGDLVLDPGGNDVLPGGTIEDDLGDYNRMWRTIFAAELYVQTLVAQDVISTIGGRILVTPTAKLTRLIIPSSNTLNIDRNGFFNGDYVIMMSAPNGIPQFEAMRITSNAIDVGSGEWAYFVQRNLDGTGANTWQEGDAVASIGGPVGSGYIELTSTRTVHNHLGPNITVYTRTGTTQWNQVKPTTAMGNLESFVDYATHEEGFAVGNDLTKDQFTGFKGATVDRTNGLRLFSTAIEAWDSTTKTLRIEPHGDILIGSSIANPSTTTLAVFSKARGYNGVSYGAGDVLIGDVTGANMHWDQSTGRLNFRWTNVPKLYLDTDGNLMAGNGNVEMGQSGLDLDSDNLGSSPPFDVDNVTEVTKVTWWRTLSSKSGRMADITAWQHDFNGGSTVASIYSYADNKPSTSLNLRANYTLAWGAAITLSATSTARFISLNGTSIQLSGQVSIIAIPSSPSGLPQGGLYRDASGFVKIVT